MATGASEFVDKTIADGVFSPDIWSKNVLVEQESEPDLRQHVNREYERDAKVGKSVIIATICDLTARAKTENTAITYETVAETPVILTLNIWDYAAFGIEDIVKVQSHINLRSSLRGQGRLRPGEGHGHQAGHRGGRVLPDRRRRWAPRSRTTTSAGAVQCLDDSQRAGQRAAHRHVPGREERQAGAGEVGVRPLPGRRQPNGGGDQVNHGQIGADIYGLTPYVTTNLVKPAAGQGNNIVFHKDAYALVMQREPKMHLFYDIDFFTWKMASEQILGHGELRDDHGVWLRGAS